MHISSVNGYNVVSFYVTMQPKWIVFFHKVATTMFNLYFMKTPENLRKEFAKALNSYHKNTPKKIRDLREAVVKSAINRPMSKNDLAILTGVGAQNVGKVEKDYGEEHSLNASIKFLIKLAIIFDIDMNYLVGLTEQPRRLSKLSGKISKENEEATLAEDKLDILIDLQRKTLKTLQES